MAKRALRSFKRSHTAFADADFFWNYPGDVPALTKLWKFGMDRVYRPFYFSLMIKDKGAHTPCLARSSSPATVQLCDRVDGAGDGLYGSYSMHERKPHVHLRCVHVRFSGADHVCHAVQRRTKTAWPSCSGWTGT